MRYAYIFSAQTVLFLLATLNIRACAKGWLRTTLLTDFMIAYLNFYLVGRIIATGDQAAQLVYASGAVAGSWLGMCISRQWRDQ